MSSQVDRTQPPAPPGGSVDARTGQTARTQAVNTRAVDSQAVDTPAGQTGRPSGAAGAGPPAGGERPAGSAPAATTDPNPEEPPGSPPMGGLILAVCCAAQFMVVLDVSIVNVALPTIRSSLGFDASSLQWVINAYTIAFAGFLLSGGRLADLFGRRRTFLIGITVFTAASLLGGSSTSAVMLVIARAVQGLGAAVVAPATLTVLATTFTTTKARTRAFGIWGAVVGAGGAVGALAGGVLTEWLSWRWILFINVPIGVVLLLLAARAITELPGLRRERTLDLWGGLSATLGVMALVYGIVGAQQHGWASTRTIGGLAVGVVILGLFLVDQARFATEPLLPLGIFRHRSVVTANLIVFASGAALFAMFYFLTLFLQQVLGYSPIRAGLAYLPLAAALMVSARGTARLLARLGPGTLLRAGLVLTAGGLGWLAFLDEHSSFVGGILGPTILVGIGQGAVMASATMAGTAGLPMNQAGLASGLINATRQLGGALGLAVLASLATTRITHTAGSPAHAQASGYALALAIAAAIPAVAVIPAIFAPGRPRPDAS
ncbi:Cephamycin export protein CmcT [Frankia sp. AiPs1]|uniref:MFS transporter n=1 Tax=Frankia sp. AiPa1 TaxID=573492 RepID=UPI00202B1A19|nr:MFS transporter [Frankia sp. AiPa1]MCL9760520.1 MFS transporter [Frankia sp. AiPa1]